MSQSEFFTGYAFDRLTKKLGVPVSSLSYDGQNGLTVNGRYAIYVNDLIDKGMVSIGVEDNEGMVERMFGKGRRFKVPKDYTRVIDFIGIERDLGIYIDVSWKHKPNSQGREENREVLANAICDSALSPLVKILLNDE